jgi:hypothetical protein
MADFSGPQIWYPVDIRRAMEDELPNKKYLLEVYAQAAAEISTTAGRKRNGPLYMVLKEIDSFIQKKTGNALSRSKKDVDLVWNLIKTVDRKITKGKVFEVLDYCLRENILDKMQPHVPRYSFGPISEKDKSLSG